MTAPETPKPPAQVVNVDEAEEHLHLSGDHWGGGYKILTPSMSAPGSLGVNLSRCPPGRSVCPFHTHQIEDEVFYILEGRGLLRYGDAVREVGPGDCISCPAGTGVAHQLANPFDRDLVYLAIGRNDPNEVCTYPDSGKIMVRSLHAIGRLEKTHYADGELDRPKILDMTPTASGPSSGSK